MELLDLRVLRRFGMALLQSLAILCFESFNAECALPDTVDLSALGIRLSS